MALFEKESPSDNQYIEVFDVDGVKLCSAFPTRAVDVEDLAEALQKLGLTIKITERSNKISNVRLV